jgi:Putative amidoligase enzyme
MQSLSSFRKPPVAQSMGIELECVVERHSPINSGEYVGFFYATTDGTIEYDWSLERGIEFVSQPLPPKWLKKEIEKLSKRCSYTTNRSCGIHIHVSKKWLSVKKATAIAKFLEKREDAFFREMFGRNPNSYCERAFNPDSRYHALNFTNSKTIEFRMFRSGPPEWAKYCVDCVCYLIEHAFHLSVDGCFAFRDIYNV